jgi:NAD(P)H-quinone oxidoreductase subunit 4
MLQMVSHGLIAAVLFFLAGVTYDRTHTMTMTEMGGIGQVMPKVFALFTIGSMASLALPGMSGFASEIAVFLGVATSDLYSPIFRTVLVVLAAVGVILTPIYLLSMLRQVFYGTSTPPSCTLNNVDTSSPFNQEAVCFGTNCVLPAFSNYSDAKPREIFIAVSFLILIIGIGFYPKLATQMYDAKTVAINSQLRESYTAIAQTNPKIFAGQFAFPEVGESGVSPVLGVLK